MGFLVPACLGAVPGAGEYLDVAAGGCEVDIGAGENLFCAGGGGAGKLLIPVIDCEPGEYRVL